jgi:positive regulator of sigma E activity
VFLPYDLTHTFIILLFSAGASSGVLNHTGFANKKCKHGEMKKKARQSENQYKSLKIKLETKVSLMARDKDKIYISGLKILAILLVIAPLFPPLFGSNSFIIISGISAVVMSLFSIKSYTFDTLKERINKAILVNERKNLC